jgi:predicted O-methyltransferase YrrM
VSSSWLNPGVPALGSTRAALARSSTYRSLRRALRVAAHPRELAFQRQIRRGFEDSFLHDRRALASYEDEIRRSGLLEHIREKRREYDAVVGASGSDGYTPGGIGIAERIFLYAILRTLKPQVAVETGVANGFSTAFALLALEKNGDGELHSIDFPREIGKDDETVFYEGTGRAGIPPESMPGWLVPEHLRKRWKLRLGRSQNELPPLLESLGAIDSFMHDSEHSFDCMWFEFTSAWRVLREGGVLISDDVNSTAAFPQFASQERREPIAIGRGMAFLVK